MQNLATLSTSVAVTSEEKRRKGQRQKVDGLDFSKFERDEGGGNYERELLEMMSTEKRDRKNLGKPMIF